MLIECQQVNVQFKDFHALENINCNFQENTITSIIGPNGGGKSTLLKTLLGLVNVSSGIIHKPQNLKISYLPQKLHINPYLPMPVWRLLESNNINKNDIYQSLTELNAKHLFAKSVHDLSGGQLQRVLLARAILRNPQLLVLDEPAQGIDHISHQALYQHITKIKNQLNCTIIMVSHDLKQALAISDQVICLNKHICCQGKGSDIHQHHIFTDMFGTI